MKQIFSTPSFIQVLDVPAPMVHRGHVLVEVKYSFISSGTELAAIESTSISNNKTQFILKESYSKVKKLATYLSREGIAKTVSAVSEKMNGNRTAGERLIPLGYSCSGRVVSVGEGVTLFRSGDYVACAGANKATHSELVLVPENLAVSIPKGCDLKDASSVAVGAIAMQAVRRAKVALGESVAVIGLGLMGQIATKMLQCSGARVIGFDINEGRAAKARKLGIDEAFDDVSEFKSAVDSFTNHMDVDVCLIAASTEDKDILQTATEITRKKGRIVVLGLVPMNFEKNPFLKKELDILASISYGPGRYDEKYEDKGCDYPYPYVRWTEKRNMEEYLRLLAEKKIELSLIGEKEFTLDNAPNAYEYLMGNNSSSGVFINYDSDSSFQDKCVTKVQIHPRVSRDQISIGVIGAGNFVKRVHLPNLKKLEHTFSLGGIVCRTGSGAMQLAKQYSAEYASTSSEDVLADPEINAVLIGTRHNLHAEMTVKALRAGKHVFVEKPLAMSEKELNEIEIFYSNCEDSNKDYLPLLLTGFNRRFSPIMTQIKEIVKNRKLPLVMNYQMNAGYLSPDHWLRTEEGGGRNIGEACHIYDLFTFLTDSEVTDIKASSIIHVTSDDHAENENFTAMLSFSDGSVGSLTYTSLGISKYPKEILNIYMDKNVLVMTDYNKLESHGLSKKNIQFNKVEKGHYEEIKAFADVLISGGEWPIPLWQQVQATRIALEVEKQIASGVTSP